MRRHRNTLKTIILGSLAITGVAAIAQPADTTSIRAFAGRSYYTDEPRAEVLVLVDGVRADEDCELRVYSGSRKLAGSGHDAIGPGQNLLAFPLDDLKAGDTEVEARLHGERGVLARTTTTLTRLVPGPNDVKIDRVSGGLVADGLPFIPFGFYAYTKEGKPQEHLAAEELARGFNMISPYQPNDLGTVEARRGYMDHCARLGMKVHFQLLSATRAAEDENDTHAFDQLRREVETFRNHPALLAWYISDEPTGHGASPQKLAAVREFIRELDPRHPVTIVFMAPHAARNYADAMDIVMADPYPIPGGSPGSVGGVTANLYKEFAHEMPVWIVPQAFGGHEHWSREPTAAEMRVMTCLSLLEGARGIQYFIRHGMNGFPKSTVAWNECAAIALETEHMTPALLSREPRPALIVDNENVRAGAWLDRGLVTIMAINTLKQPQNMRLALENHFVTGAARAVFEDRDVEIVNGVINDMIDAYGTRVYEVRVAEAPPDAAAQNPRNLALNPSFENNFSPGVPAGCYGNVGSGRGVVYRVEPRLAVHGRNSLRLHVSEPGDAVGISPFPINLVQGQGYTASVWARAQATPLAGDEVPEMPRFTLSMASVRSLEASADSEEEELASAEETFELTSQWKRYTISGVAVAGGRGNYSLSLSSPGTAWFDLLEVTADPVIETGANENGELTVTIKTFVENGVVHYTTDGSRPTAESPPYRKPLTFDHSTTLTAAVFVGDEFVSAGFAKVHKHDANGCPVEHANPYGGRYPGGGRDALTDGVRASAGDHNAFWQGFEGVDMMATIDLGREVEIRRLSAGCLQAAASWIYLPRSVEYFVSDNGEAFVSVATVENPHKATAANLFVEDFEAEIEPVTARYVRVHARTIGKLPGWGSGEGGDAWIFADEIQVNPDR